MLCGALPAFAQNPVGTLGALGPTGLAIDTVAGVTYLYVAEFNDGKVTAYNLTSGSTTPVGSITGFTNPNGILIDPATHDLFITDRGSHKITRVTNTGTVVWQYGSLGTGSGQFDGPVGITRDSTGAIYITEHNNNRVQKFTVGATGLVPVTTGWPVTGLSTPYAVAVDASNNVYVGDRSGTILKYNSAGAAQTSGNISVGRITTGLTMVGTSLYATETVDGPNGNRVQRFPSAGATADLTFGADGTTAGGLNLAFNTVVNGTRAYVSAYSNNFVQIYDLSVPPGGGSTDTTAPTVSVAVGTGATATSVPFVVTFNESVTGGAAATFTASGAGATIASVTPSSTTATTSYTVTVNFTGTSGTVTLGLSSAANTAIKDASNNFFAGGVTSGGSASASYTIPASGGGGGDTTAPKIVSFELNSAATTASTGAWRVTFNEAVTGVDAADFVHIAGSGATITPGTVTAVSATVYDVNFGWAAPGGTGFLQGAIRTSGTNIKDAAGNDFRGEGPAATPVAGTGVSFDAPAVSSFTAGTPSGTSVNLTLTFSEAVTGLGASDFLASAGATVNAPTGSGTTYTVPVTVTGPGTYTVTVIGGATSDVRDSSTYYFAGGSTNASVTFTVGGSGGSAPTISAQSTSGQVGTAMNYQVVATGATSFSTTSTLPAGLTLSSAGVISGMPTAATPSGGTVVNVTATNANGSNSAPVTITIAAAPPSGSAPTISAQSTSGTVGTAMNFQVVATGATSFSTTSTLPAGLTLSSAGVISGTPTAATPSGGTVVNVTATNTYGSSSAAVTITIAAAPPTGSAPTMSNQTVTGTQGSAVNYQVVATGATSFSIVGTTTLQTGLTMNSSGMISGTPTVTGSRAVTVRATNSFGTKDAVITVTINAPAADTTAPSALSFSKTSETSTTVTFTLVFSEAVTGVDATDFTVSKSGTMNATVASVTGSGTTYTVVANYTGSGSMALVLKNTGTGIADAASNALVTGIASATFSNTTSTPPPTTTPPPVVFIPPPSTPTSPVTKQSQTLTFVSPVSSVLVGKPVALSATASSGLPVTFTVILGNADISGNMLTLNDTKPVLIRATQAGNSTYNAASSDITLTATRGAQLINFPASATVSLAQGRITLNATSTAGLPISYSLVSGPATLNGNTLTLNGLGTVVVRATQGGDDSYLAADDVTRSFVIVPAGQQVFIGTVGSDAFAAVVNGSDTKGVFMMRLASTGEAVVIRFDIAANGSFSAKGRTTGGATSRELTLQGTVRNGALSATIPELNAAVTATAQSFTGSTASFAGLYVANAVGSASGDTYLVVGPNGQAFALNVTGNTAAWGTGTVNANGAVSVTLSQNGSITATLDSSKAALNGRVTAAGSTRDIAGLSNDADRLDRLVNLSSRLRVSGNDASRSAIVGFVITGSERKQVLVRAVGPGLRGFGVNDALNDPNLQIFDGAGRLVTENDNWSSSTELNTATDRVGAFKLTASSRDSAIVTTLAPGAYTAVVTGVNGEGVVLVEVYDTANREQVATNELINISTRGYVGTGDDSLIAGFVVTGNTPKRVLVRGVGPALSGFGLSGALSNPVLQIFAAGNANAIAQNDNWGTAQPINATQVVATAAEITAASTAAGAFPLAAGSADAAIVITLMPGNYSAVVTGANNATGAGLVEVYELPNP